jgi:hypothetical protein
MVEFSREREYSEEMSEEISNAAWEFILTASGDKRLAEGYQDRSFDCFFNDLKQLSKKDARYVLLAMAGRDEEVPADDYNKLRRNGWYFQSDWSEGINQTAKYGYDEKGRMITGSLVDSPNHLFSVSIFDVAKFINSQELYKDFFGRLFKK